MVDSVSEVIEIAQADIEPAPQFGTTIAREFIHGLGKVGGEFLVILEPERALNIDDMAEIAAKSATV
jgi:purine-binding chemotaxis protein CheW